MASNGKAVTGTAVMARSANEEKKKHAHLNYACLRASDAGLPGGGAA